MEIRWVCCPVEGGWQSNADEIQQPIDVEVRENAVPMKQ